MKYFGTTFFEIVIVSICVIMGLGNHKFLFLQSTRSWVIFMGILGMLMCTISIGNFISINPWHPLTILGYILGGICIIVFLIQLFNIDLPIISNSRKALIIMGVSIIIKGFIGRFVHLLK